MRAAGPTDKPLISFFQAKKERVKSFFSVSRLSFFCCLNRLKCKRGLQGNTVLQIEKDQGKKEVNIKQNINTNTIQYSSRFFSSETVEKYRIYPLKSEGFFVIFNYKENHQ